ncbi:valine--tRNA ligase [Candidatus Dependentiae bacterium]|nr:valine--tRNA ligase [Candidatus Dependentiae bacterium]
MLEQKYNHQEQESRLARYWYDHGIYAYRADRRPVVTIDTPPPTVSGSLHIGHIFSYTQTDIIARYLRMSGNNVFYPFGFDDNGLPTERYVEKMTGSNPYAVGRAKFIELCLATTATVEQQFQDLWTKIGLSVDWQQCYSTISDTTRAISQESFLRLLQQGDVYKRLEPALYCTVCRTSVAQAELDDAERPSAMHEIVFTGPSGETLLIGTTRPELLAACVALLYNPQDSRYQHLAGKQATTPLFHQQVPILADETVLMDKGTGLVMCCTYGDRNDITWQQNHNLAYKQAIGLDGIMTPMTGPLAGMKVKQARAATVTLLQELNALVSSKELTHTVNIHERCKHEIEYLLLSQWFLKTLAYKAELIALAEQVSWHPAHMKARYIDWVNNLSWDWCLSRQRFFGIPFPVWHCNSCLTIIPASLNQLPIDPLQTAYTGVCPHCGSGDIRGDNDVMDTWNTSSLTPQLCHALYQQANKQAVNVFATEGNDFIPMSLRPQAHDIIRTWAFDTMVKSWLHFGKVPWKDIVISGHVLANDRSKLSKSKDNSSMTPEGLLAQWPADVIRFWTASGSLGLDINFSENQLKIGHKLVTKLWNAFRFVDQHYAEYRDIGGVVPTTQPADLGTINEWILDAARQMFEQYDANLRNFEFGLALTHADKFFWHQFCDNYLELIKDQLFNKQQHDPAQVGATLWTLRQVGLQILQVYAPYLPYVTEAIYQELYATKQHISIHSTTYAETGFAHRYAASFADAEYLLQIISLIRSCKSDAKLSLKTPVDSLVLYCPDLSQLAIAERNRQLLQGFAKAAAISFAHNQPGVTSLTQDGDKIAQMLIALPEGRAA